MSDGDRDRTKVASDGSDDGEGDRDRAKPEGDEADRAKAAGDGGDAPKPEKKKKRRRKKRPAEAAEPDAPDEAQEDGRPAFARGYPRDGALDALVDAFERGDYARVRSDAPALARTTKDDEIRRAARDLRGRVDPDPLAVYLVAGALALLVVLAGYYWTHPHVP